MILDPIGNVPIFASLLRKFEPSHQKKIIYRESFIALIAMIIFLFFGKAIYRVLNIDQTSLEIAGGILLFLIALKLIFPKKKKDENHLPPQEPFIVPLAIPAIAGPGILAMISLYGAMLPGKKLSLLTAIFVAWLLTIPFLLLSITLKRLIGDKGLGAMEKLIGFILVLLGLQMGLGGLQKAFAA